MKVGDILIARASVMMVKYSRESDELFIIGGKGYRISLIEEKDGDIEYIYINSEHTNEHCINYNSIEHYAQTAPTGVVRASTPVNAKGEKVSPFKYNFKDYFYTEQEIRKMKLKKLNYVEKG